VLPRVRDSCRSPRLKVIEGSQRIAVGLASKHRFERKRLCQIGTVLPLSWGDHQGHGSGQSSEADRGRRDGWTKPWAKKRPMKSTKRVAGRFGGIDQTVRGRHRIVKGTSKLTVRRPGSL